MNKEICFPLPWGENCSEDDFDNVSDG